MQFHLGAVGTPAAPFDPPVHTVELPSGPVAYTDDGEGPCLVLIHGLPGSGRDFRWLGPCLEGLRVVRIDLPGFGDTPLATRPSARLHNRGSFVAEVLAALGLERVVLLGHSFGGPLAVEAAVRSPDRVVGLALLSSVGSRIHRGKRSFGPWRLLSTGLRTGLGRRLLMPQLRAGFLKSGFPRSTPDEILVQTAHCIAWTPIDRHRRNLLGLDLPTLIAWAEDDPLVEPAISEELAAACGAGPRLSWPTGGHNIQKTHARELGRALSEWLPKLWADFGTGNR